MNLSFKVITFLLLVNCCCASKLDLTVKISPGKQECFWQNLPAETNVQMIYQVISGGDLDINLVIAGPENKVYHMEQKKTKSTVRYKSGGDGNYKFCFDNTFSRLSTKAVYFEVLIDNGKDVLDDNDSKLTFDGENIGGQLDITVEEFVGILDMSKKNLAHSIQIQTLIRVHEAMDRNVQEANFFQVNFFSCCQLILMMFVGLVQILLIRSLFRDKTVGSPLKVRT